LDGLDDFSEGSLDNIVKRVRQFFKKLNNFFSEGSLDNIVKRAGQYIELDNRKIVIIYLVIMVGLLSIFYNHDMGNKNNLIQDISSDYDYVYDNYLVLNESYYNLLSNKVLLESYYDDALNMYEVIYDNYSDMLDVNAELMDEYHVLQNILSNTTAKNSELQILYMQLSDEYEDLALELENPSNFSLSEIITEDESLSLGPEEFTTYVYNISNPGYFEVLFSSSVDIFVWVGSSGSEPSYYTRYPVYPNIAFEGRFVVPVVGDEIYLYFENPSEDVGAFIEFSVVHVY